MERKSSRKFTREVSLERRLTESRKLSKTEPSPDLTDFMNDMFFGTVSTDKKAYNLTGGGKGYNEEDDFDSSTRSNSSTTTQEWLEEARQMVANSPSRYDPPSRLGGSPRFAAAAQGRLSLSSPIERRDPLSRSARRHRAVDSFSGEILTKSAKHSRNGSETSLLDTPPDSPTDQSPAAAVHRWFSNILKLPNPSDPAATRSPHVSPDQNSQLLPPRQSFRKSRFQNDPNVAPSQGINIPPRRQFKTSTTSQDNPFLSPPKTLIESSQRRSISSTTCSVSDSRNRPLSPPRKLVESVHRRSTSSSTCSLDKISPKGGAVNGNTWSKEDREIGDKEESINGFLEEQRVKIGKMLSGEINGRAKIVLSGSSNSCVTLNTSSTWLKYLGTSSMVAAICYAWLLQNRICKNKGECHGEKQIVVPVMNIRRGRMWKQQQAAWLFHHVGVDATSLVFADEVDLESLMMAGKLSMLVIGQDILKTNSEVGSQCTILTDNYCEEAYDLLQTAVLKKLLLAGILLDTQNLNASAKLTTTRDAEAVQLLLVGSAPNYRNALFDQLMQDSQDSSFFEVLRHNYGKSPTENGLGIGAQAGHRVPERKSTSVSHSEATTKSLDARSNDDRTPKSNKVSTRSDKQSSTPAKAPAQAAAENATKGKNKFFLAKWFGFGK